jgi:hypothetical protein
MHYTFENTGATFAKLKLVKGSGVARKTGTGELKFSSDVEGSCFGYSIDWAQRMVQYKGDIQKSRPNKGIGTALQQRFEMKFKAGGGDKWSRNATAVAFMVRTVSLRMVEHYRIDDDDIADEVDTENSVVVFDNGLHWMGMAKVGGKRFYFDSNDGLYSASDIADYRRLVELFVDDYDSEPNYSKSWDVYSVAAS